MTTVLFILNSTFCGICQMDFALGFRRGSLVKKIGTLCNPAMRGPVGGGKARKKRGGPLSKSALAFQFNELVASQNGHLRNNVNI